MTLTTENPVETLIIAISETVLAENVSHDEFWAGFDDMRVEWVDGKVIEMPGITNEHDALTHFLTLLLDACVLHTEGGGRVLRDPMIMVLPDISSRAPDIQVLLGDKVNNVAKNRVVGAADIVVEVISPGSARTDRVAKFAEYERGGVREYWIIDYKHREALFFVLTDGKKYERAELDEQGFYRGAVIPQLRFEVALLWRKSLPNLLEVVELVKGMFAPQA